MQKKAPKTVALHRETLYNLSSRPELEQVAGGFSIPPITCGNSNQTCDLCPTYSCGRLNCL